jgi:hypothetical protein
MTDTVFYAEMQDVAQELLDGFGQPVTLVIEGSAGGGYDASGDPLPATPDVAVSGLGAVTPYNIKEIDGTVIQSGDCKFYYEGVAPEIGMVVTLSGIKWRVVSVSITQPGGIVVMYTCQLRK